MRDPRCKAPHILTLKYRRVSLFPLLLCMVILWGCGYAVRGSGDLPFRDVRIGLIRNMTFEPGIEDMLQRKLAEAFLREGIDVKEDSDNVLDGEIRSFSLRIVSEKDSYSREYEVSISADFRLGGPDGTERRFNAVRSPFIESFIAERDMNSIISFKEVATERALEELARRLVTEVIFR